MLINLLVQSEVSAPANGYLQVSIDSSQPVGNLITKFCEDKGIENNSQYCLIDTENKILDCKKSISHYGLQSGDKVIFCSAIEEISGFQSWSFIAVVALVLAIIGFIACLGIYLGFIRIPDSYAMVLDAGSTHTEILLYKWAGSKINNTGIVGQDEVCSISTGLGELTSREDVSHNLSPCLNKLMSRIPSESLDHAEVFFGATAGFRVLEEKNATFAAQMLTEVRHTLQNTGLKFTPEKARILTGTEEGATGWLTVNYLNDKLLAKEETYGALDLGGASTQISFELNETQTPPKNESLVASLQVYGRKIKVFSKSFLCYGLIQIMKRYRSHLILTSLTAKDNKVISPCDHLGHSEIVTPDYAFGSPCSPQPKPNFITSQNYTFVGSSDVELCHKEIQYILSEKFCQDYNLRECISLQDFPEGFQDQKFMAFSAFGYVRRAMRINPNATREDYLNKIKDRCGQSWDEVSLDYKNNNLNITFKDTHTYCLKQMYMITLLSDIYQFNTEDKWSNIEFGLKIKDKNLGWGLGFMVNETQSIASAPSLYGMNTLVFSLLILLFSLFLFVGIGFVIQACKSKKPKDRTYRSLAVQP